MKPLGKITCWAALRGMLLEHAVGRTENYEDAEDLVQDVLERALEHRVFETMTAAEWCHATLTNLATDRGRQCLRRAEILEQVTEPNESTEPSPPEFSYGGMGVEVTRALRVLNADQRHAIIRYYQHDEDDHEIAHTLGIPRLTIATRLCRARCKLRETLQRRAALADVVPRARYRRAFLAGEEVV